MTNVREVARAIQTCRRSRTVRGMFAGASGWDLEEAYRVQRLIAEERVAAGDAVVGYKLGLISPSKQHQMGVSEPIVGHLHRSMMINQGEPVRRNAFVQPRVEPELAVLFSRDVSAPGRRADLLGAIAGAMLIVDVLDSIYEGYRFTAADVVADNASGGAILLGSRLLPPDVLWQPDVRLSLALDGGEAAEGVLASIGDPLELLAWAAERINGLGRGIRQGDLVLLGAPCAAQLVGNAKMLVAEGPEGSRVISPIVNAPEETVA